MRCGRGPLPEHARPLGWLLLAAAALVGLGTGLGAILHGSSATQTVQRVIVVDSDGGPDDALAILLLLAAENESIFTRTRILAVTCVRGNTGVYNVTRNVLATLQAANRSDVPVFTGAVYPLVPPTVNFSYYYGYDGFGDFLPPALPAASNGSEHAVLALLRLAKEYPGELTLLCIGPLTNIALAYRLDPSFLDSFKEIFILGSAAHGNGNTKPGAEFNVYMDPEAAKVVYVEAKNLFYISPWETALAAEIPISWRLNTMGTLNTSAIRLLNQAERKVLNDSTWVSADGLLAASLIDANVVTSRPETRISVLTGEGAARGVTLVDLSDTLELAPNAVILEKPDVSAFQRLVLRLMSRG